MPGLLALCAERGLSNAEIARICGVPTTDLTKWRRDGVPLAAIHTLAQALRTTPEALVAYLDKRHAEALQREPAARAR
jgi:DNA-binding Xre family transcriptional regulator